MNRPIREFKIKDRALPKRIYNLEPRTIEIPGIPRHEAQFMVERRCGQKAVNRRDRAAAPFRLFSVALFLSFRADPVSSTGQAPESRDFI